MKKKLLFLFLSVLFFLWVISFFVFQADNISLKEVRYDTVNGVKVTKDNICMFLPKVPGEIKKKVIGWFKNNKRAYEILVKQDCYLSDVGNMIMKGDLLQVKNKIKNLGDVNYVFKLPDQDFFIKIFGPNNRFLRTVKHLGINGSTLYMRDVRKFVQGVPVHDYRYMGFDEDKKRIQEYFYACVSGDFLKSVPNQGQIKNLIYVVAGALPQSILRGLVYNCLVERYIKGDYCFGSKSVGQLFDEFLDYTFEVVRSRCYRKSDLVDQKCIDTFSCACRMFHYLRFCEAIEMLGLYRLEKPPKTYILNVNDKDPNCYADKNVVVLQEVLRDHKRFEFYLKRPDILDKVFDGEVILQLLTAMQYAGLWDITGENIYVNTKNNKVTYIDFEPKNDSRPEELFNNSEEKLRFNLCYLVLEFIKRFPDGTDQRKVVDKFIKDNKQINIDWYIKKFNERLLLDNKDIPREILVAMKKRLFLEASPLGNLLYYSDPKGEKREYLRKQVVDLLNKK